MKRTPSGLSALIAIDKPAGMTSHDVVNRVRRICGERRVGHAGTLDPEATGVLILGVGPATRLLTSITGHDKEYLACIRFGVLTDTLDAAGEVVQEASVPEELMDASWAQEKLDAITGGQMQAPPAYSAKRVDGKHAYDRVRKGEDVQLDPVQVYIFTAQLAGAPFVDEGEHICWNVRFRVSAGTYIRSIARDLGQACGTVASLSALVRLCSGRVNLQDAVSLEQLEAEGLVTCCLDPVLACGVSPFAVDPSQERAIMDGKRIPAPDAAEGHVYGLVCEDRLLGLHQVQDGYLVAKTVIPGGVTGVA